ncbi:MAG: hypothetical protein AMXMBFR82_29800 [Candidatus Hydrogenedentota bacterium]
MAAGCEQIAEIEVKCQNDAFLYPRFLEDRRVGRSVQPFFAKMYGIVSFGP